MPEENETVTEGPLNEASQAAGSYGREVQQRDMSETMGTQSPPDQRREDTQGEKESTDTAGTNPKRTENSRPD